jgi:glucose-6-phosphate 1-dehydrogenase
MAAYERVLTDAMAGDATLFAHQDHVPVPKAATPVFEYEPQTLSPEEVERLTPPGGWQSPMVTRD